MIWLLYFVSHVREEKNEAFRLWIESREVKHLQECNFSKTLAADQLVTCLSEDFFN